VLTRQEWKGVLDFSTAIHARIITSFATSPGTRNADGVWTPQQAEQVVDYTGSLGGSIAAAEFMNEPSFAEMGGAPKGYDAAAYGRDMAKFTAWAKAAVPGMLVLGPSAVGEGVPLGPAGSLHLLKSEDLLTASDPKSLNVFSYHFYGAVSRRCSGMQPALTMVRELAPNPSTPRFATGSLRANRSGLLRPGKPHAVETPGHLPLLTVFDI
jgi:hypothetical protein